MLLGSLSSQSGRLQLAAMCRYSGNNAITVCFEFGRFIHTAPLIPPGLMKTDMAFFRVTLLLFEGGLQMQRMFLLFG